MGRPVVEPVQSATTSNERVSEGASSSVWVAIPSPASASLAQCLPIRLTRAPARRATQREQTELAVAQDRQTRPRPEVDLLGDPERGGQWLDEQGRAVADGVRDLVEVGLRDAHPFGHGAVVVEDAQNGPVRAVLGTAGVAGVATPAGVVDLGRHPASVRRFADELVAEHPSESHVTARQLQVGLADAGGADLSTTSPAPARAPAGRGGGGPTRRRGRPLSS